METQKGFVSLLGGRRHSSCAIAAALMQAARRLCEGDDHGRIGAAPRGKRASAETLPIRVISAASLPLRRLLQGRMIVRNQFKCSLEVDDF